MKMKRLLIATAAAGLLVVGCSADETDFKDKAEEVISDEWKKQFDEELTGVTCDDPGSTDVGTTFDCSATGPDGTEYSFTAEITAENEVTVTQTA